MKPSTFAIALLCCASSLAAQDRPDPDFIDSDGDGIDGEEAAAVFVAGYGNDAFAGTKSEPMATIGAAIARAASTGKSQVYVSRGTYSARVTLVSGIDLYGGFDGLTGWVRKPEHVSTIRSTTVTGGRIAALEAHNLGVDTRVEAINIETGNTVSTGISNYAVLVAGSGAGSLRLRYLTITAGNAGPGQAAAAGTTPATEADGTPGGDGSCGASVTASGGPGGTSSCGVAGGRGGNGGAPGNGGANGLAGVGGSSPGFGGGAGSPAGDGSGGGNGASGAVGADGAAGASGPPGGTYAFPYVGGTGGKGADGTPGGGGAGGGGGGGEDCGFCLEGTGNGGGGGGAGGCPGTGGGGGFSGGGSFGVYAPSGRVVLEAVRIRTGTGGAGGTGGTGGPGGSGGAGAFGAQVCTTEVGSGGRGGNGGVGGRGGHGGGGPGGPSIAIVVPDAASVGDAVRVTLGNGGAPGTSLGHLGAAGAVLASAPANVALAGMPTLSVAPASATEGSGVLRFVVTLAAITEATVQVGYTTAAGSADATDYTPVSGTLVFDPWTSRRTIDVPLANDTIGEAEESFTLVLSAPSGATIAAGTAEGRIVDDDERIFLVDGFESPAN